MKESYTKHRIRKPPILSFNERVGGVSGVGGSVSVCVKCWCVLGITASDTNMDTNTDTNVDTNIDTNTNTAHKTQHTTHAFTRARSMCCVLGLTEHSCLWSNPNPACGMCATNVGRTYRTLLLVVAAGWVHSTLAGADVALATLAVEESEAEEEEAEADVLPTGNIWRECPVR